MKRTRVPVFLLVTAAFALILSACGSPTPTATPRPAPTNTEAAVATEAATAEVAVAPTTAPTEAATAAATTEATTAATVEATAAATEAATVAATTEATTAATAEATVNVAAGTLEATTEATAAPTEAATTEPTVEATAVVTEAATVAATEAATAEPTAEATAAATEAATVEATVEATAAPTEEVAMAATATTVATLEATAAATTEATAAPTAEATAAATLGACKTSGELLVATDAAYPPFESVDTTTNQIVGFDIDLLNAIAEGQGFTINAQNAPFDTIFINLAAGQYDLVISAATITEERQKTVSFSDPYFVAGQVIIVRDADKTTISSPDDLIGKKIGVQLGTTGAEAAKGIKDAKVSEYPTFPEAAQALANGDVDAVINDNATSLTYILNTPDLKLVVVGASFTTEDYGIAVRQDCGDLLTKINTGLAEIIASGKYAEIYRKYFGEDPSAEFLPGGASATPEATAAATTEATAAATTEATAAPTAEATAEATP